MENTVSDVRLSLVWTRLVDEALTAPFAPLTSDLGFRDALRSGTVAGIEVQRPWESDGSSWSRFWSSYLGSPRQLRELDPSAAWDRLVPFSTPPQIYTGPDELAVEFRSLLYPHAVVITATLNAEGSWPVAELAAAVADMRTARAYGPESNGSRSLDGIASDLADASAKLLSPGARSMGASDPYSVVAPTRAEGDETAFDLEKETVRACLAGLATTGPNGTASDDNFLDSNTDTNLKAAIYATRRGHAIWRPDSMLAVPPDGSLTCLHRNHTAAVAQVEALSQLASWVSETGYVDAHLRPLVSRALLRLDQFEAGDRKKTYRSGIIKKRVEPQRSLIDDLRTKTGLGFGP